MVFLSCRIVFPADTCTVTVLMPSRENVYATLPSRVITGCWGREREREMGSQIVRAPVRDPYQRLVNISHCCYLHYRGVRLLADSQKHTQTHTQDDTQLCWSLCCAAAQRPTGSFLCDTSSSLLSLLTSPFVLQIALRC